MWVDDFGPGIIAFAFIGPILMAWWMARSSRTKEESDAWTFSIFGLAFAFFVLYSKVLFGH